MAGSVGCFTSLVMVGSLIAAYGDNWPAHQSAGRVAIAFVYIYDIFFSFSWAPVSLSHLENKAPRNSTKR